MKYLGGKSRIAKEIVKFLESERINNQMYIEPFIGSCAIFEKMNSPKKGGDISKDLIYMWKAIQDGWIPPKEVEEIEYNKIKNEQPSALRGFIGFGCSWGGKFFGGYARENSDRNFALNAHNQVLKTRNGIYDALIQLGDYTQFSSEIDSLIYCDIPYKNTTKYSMNFDYGAFYDWAIKMSKNNKIFISEYAMPDEFIEVYSIERNLELKSNNQARRIEKIFTVK